MKRIIALVFLCVFCSSCGFIAVMKSDSKSIDRLVSCKKDFVITRNSIPTNPKISDDFLINTCNPISKGLTVKYNTIISDLKVYKSVTDCPTCVDNIKNFCDETSEFKTMCGDNSTSK